MTDDRMLSRYEVAGILARLGMKPIYSAGEHTVYVSDQDERIVLLLTERWDTLFSYLVADLSAIGISRTEIEAALESLYSAH